MAKSKLQPEIKPSCRGLLQRQFSFAGGGDKFTITGSPVAEDALASELGIKAFPLMGESIVGSRS